MTKYLATYASAAALALSLTALAAPVRAATLIDIDVATSGAPGSNQVVWTATGPGQGTFAVTGITTLLNFNDALYADGTGTQALLTIKAKTTTPGLSVALPNFTQAGIDGYFEFRKKSNPTIVLLRGDFTNFWLTGIKGDKAGNLTSVGGELNLTSAVANLTHVKEDNAIFGFTNASPKFAITGAGANRKLSSFKAGNLTGSFGGAIPEPASWALMIMGFGGVGAMIRRRKTSAALA
jgi:hypothetical protein